MNSYEMRQEERRERLEAAAARARAESDRRSKVAHDLLDMIPPGQPILVGHYSERGHRAHLRKVDRNIAKSIEADKLAKDFARRADAVGSAGISSDDPDAVAKLKEQLVELEAEQARKKAVNAAHKRFLKDPASLDGADLSDADKARIRNYKPAYSWEPHPYPPYSMQNANANIRRIKQRIADLQQNAGRESSERVVGDVRIVRDAEDNRLRLIFPGKPDDALRAKLKGHGFRWSPMAGAWQRQLSPAAEWAAERVLEGAA